MQTPFIAHRCGRAYGPDSSRQALLATLLEARLPASRPMFASRATVRSFACTTPGCRVGPR